MVFWCLKWQHYIKDICVSLFTFGEWPFWIIQAHHIIFVYSRRYLFLFQINVCACMVLTFLLTMKPVLFSFCLLTFFALFIVYFLFCFQFIPFLFYFVFVFFLLFLFVFPVFIFIVHLHLYIYMGSNFTKQPWLLYT